MIARVRQRSSPASRGSGGAPPHAASVTSSMPAARLRRTGVARPRLTARVRGIYGLIVFLVVLAFFPVAAQAAAARLYAFGLNHQGQLGSATNNGTNNPNPMPALVSLPGATGSVSQVAAGFEHSLVSTSSGQLYAFGDNDFAQLGSGSGGTTNPNPTPALVSLPGASGPVVQVAGGFSHSLALTSTGQLYAFGDNFRGELGIATNSGTFNPDPPSLVSLPGATGRVAEIAAGDEDSFALTSTGQLYAFGYNQYGELGIATNSGTGNANPTPTPVSLPGATGPVTQIAAGYFHSLAVTSTGQLYAFGINDEGELASTTNNGNGNPNPTPALVSLPSSASRVVQIAAGAFHSLALTSTGQLYSFGGNGTGQLGTATNSGNANPNPTPALVSMPSPASRIVQIAAGQDDSLALTSTSQLYSFGDNERGELGIATNSGTTNPNPTPALVSIQAGAHINALSRGPTALHTLVVLTPAAVSRPSCTLKTLGRRVFASTLVEAAKHKHKKKHPKGQLKLAATCNQAASLTLNGKVTALLKKRKRTLGTVDAAKGHKHKKKHKTKTFKLRPVHASIGAGKTITIIAKLTKAALRALKQGAHESVVFTLIATNSNGTSTTSAKIKRIKLAKTKHRKKH